MIVVCSDLEYDETYIFVLVNRWPANPDVQSGANFPGIQTHPVHMHGHSFYVLAQSAGTIRQNVRPLCIEQYRVCMF